MSGIAGYFSRQRGRSAGETHIREMLARMHHRARDGHACWTKGQAALGHAWLNTTGEAAPGLLVTGDLAIAADCRLDNRDELLACLGLTDTPSSDAALILQSYLRWGERCVEHLQGDFAFAIWDGAEHRFFCARDHFGVKPFYYTVGSDRLLFASEIRPILGITGTGDLLNENHIAGFLAGLADDPQSTPYRSVLRLPAGHTLSIGLDGLALRRYWQPEPRTTEGHGNLEEEFRHLFVNAVRNRLRGTQAVGAMLSGGLDSSSIAAVASAFAMKDGRKLPTFSMVFEPGSPQDERPFIEAMLAAGGFESHLVDVAGHAPFEGFRDILDEQEGTFLAPGLSRTRKLYEAARAGGVTVLLNGHGGDEVVSHGFRRLHELAHDGAWLELWREVGSLAKAHGTPAWRPYAEFLLAYGPAQRLRGLRRAATRALAGSGVRPLWPAWRTFIDPALARRAELRERWETAATAPGPARTSEALHHRWQLSSGLAAHAFEVLDKTAAHFQIEPRYPFWDRPLVEFCLSMPSDAKLKRGWSRLVLRRAMEGILPPAVQWRRDKVDFKPSLSAGIARFHQPLVDDLLETDGMRIAPFVELTAVKAAYRRLVENPAEAAMDDIQSVWRSVALSLWLRQIESKGTVQ
jgi:asparagine synthase (glutamine-hydrolysing)